MFINSKGAYIEYTGELRNGLPNGNGTGKFVKRSATYRGSWKNGLPHGKGRLDFANGDWYQGSFENQEWTGDGLFHMNGETTPITFVYNSRIDNAPEQIGSRSYYYTGFEKKAKNNLVV